MINNTSPQRWSRVSAKSIDTQFRVAMQEGLNCSPFESQIMVDKVHQFYGPLFDSSAAVQPGQVQTVVLDAGVPPGVPLTRARQKLVTVTLLDRTDVETQRTEGIPALRRKRLARLCEEAFQQGGLFTLEDLALLLNCGLRTLVADLALLRQQHLVPPLRSTVQDIGRAVTHRVQILSLWLQGKEYDAIALETHHSLAAVASYVDKFKRAVTLLEQGFDVPTAAFLVRLSPLMVEQFQRLYARCRAARHRQQELRQAFKKNQLNVGPALRRRPS